MKSLVLSIAMLFSLSYAYAQDTPQATECYNEWYAAFQKYGATTVTDGTHEVIISVCKYSKCDCLLGTVDVVGGQLVPGSVMIQQADGTYERPARTLSQKYTTNPDTKLEKSIYNGMSPTYLTSQDEMVNILFYKNLNKAPKVQKKAPSPGELGFK